MSINYCHDIWLDSLTPFNSLTPVSLLFKSAAFALRKRPFCTPKVPLLKTKSGTFEKRVHFLYPDSLVIRDFYIHLQEKEIEMRLYQNKVHVPTMVLPLHFRCTLIYINNV